MNKYNAKRVYHDNRFHDSIGEKNHYIYLKLLEKAGEISNLECQKRYVLSEGFTNGSGEKIRSLSIVVDFQYLDDNKNIIVEDFKGFVTDCFLIKKKLFEKRYYPLVIKIIKS